MNEPQKIKAGFSYSWTESLSEYPASQGWVMKYVLINQSSKLEIPSVADGDNHKVAVSAADSAKYEAGQYGWCKFVEKGEDRYELEEGSLEIVANILTSNTLDTRTQARKTLDAINATILGSASKDQASLSVDGMALQRRSYKELLSLKAYYEDVVDQEERREKRKRGLPSGGRILFRFGKS